ncbi:MAG: MaoC family dehydratase [Dehalococcoidales bacterium]
MTPVKLNDLREGSDLPGIKKDIKQERVNQYAEASGDFNPIHLDEEFARNTPAGGRIAHGMLILAYASEMMTAAFDRNWLTGGKLNVRFKIPARPGDTITVSGKVTKLEKNEENTLIYCAILCTNQDGETVITGDATVTIKN